MYQFLFALLFFSSKGKGLAYAMIPGRPGVRSRNIKMVAGHSGMTLTDLCIKKITLDVRFCGYKNPISKVSYRSRQLNGMLKYPFKKGRALPSCEESGWLIALPTQCVLILSDLCQDEG